MKSEIPTVEIFCFGSMKKLPESGLVVGGYAAVMAFGDKTKTVSGSQLNATNYVMDIIAITKSLMLLKVPCQVKLYSTNQTVVNTINLDYKMKTYPELKPELKKAMEPHKIEAILPDLIKLPALMELAKKEAQKERQKLEDEEENYRKVSNDAIDEMFENT